MCKTKFNCPFFIFKKPLIYIFIILSPLLCMLPGNSVQIFFLEFIYFILSYRVFFFFQFFILWLVNLGVFFSLGQWLVNLVQVEKIWLFSWFYISGKLWGGNKKAVGGRFNWPNATHQQVRLNRHCMRWRDTSRAAFAGFPRSRTAQRFDSLKKKPSARPTRVHRRAYLLTGPGGPTWPPNELNLVTVSQI